MLSWRNIQPAMPCGEGGRELRTRTFDAVSASLVGSLDGSEQFTHTRTSVMPVAFARALQLTSVGLPRVRLPRDWEALPRRERAPEEVRTTVALQSTASWAPTAVTLAWMVTLLPERNTAPSMGLSSVTLGSPGNEVERHVDAIHVAQEQHRGPAVMGAVPCAYGDEVAVRAVQGLRVAPCEARERYPGHVIHIEAGIGIIDGIERAKRHLRGAVPREYPARCPVRAGRESAPHPHIGGGVRIADNASIKVGAVHLDGHIGDAGGVRKGAPVDEGPCAQSEVAQELRRIGAQREQSRRGEGHRGRAVHRIPRSRDTHIRLDDRAVAKEEYLALHWPDDGDIRLPRQSQVEGDIHITHVAEETHHGEAVVGGVPC